MLKKIVISRDVVFEEDEKWNWNASVGGTKNDVLKWEDEDDMEGSEQEDSEDSEQNGEEIEEGDNEVGNAVGGDVAGSSPNDSTEDLSPNPE